MKSCRFAAAPIASHAKFEHDSIISARKASRETWLKGVVGRRGRKAWSEDVAERRGRKAWREGVAEQLAIFKSREDLPFAEIFFDLKRTRIGLQFSEGRS